MNNTAAITVATVSFLQQDRLSFSRGKSEQSVFGMQILTKHVIYAGVSEV